MTGRRWHGRQVRYLAELLAAVGIMVLPERIAQLSADGGADGGADAAAGGVRLPLGLRRAVSGLGLL